MVCVCRSLRCCVGSLPSLVESTVIALLVPAFSGLQRWHPMHTQQCYSYVLGIVKR